MNVGYLLVNSASNYPDRTAIISEERRFSYKTFNHRVNRLARAMRQYGLKKGDRVALMSFNTHHFAEAYFATAKLGALLTPVNFRFVGEEKVIITWTANCAAASEKSEKWPLQLLFKKSLTPFLGPFCSSLASGHG